MFTYDERVTDQEKRQFELALEQLTETEIQNLLILWTGLEQLPFKITLSVTCDRSNKQLYFSRYDEPCMLYLCYFEDTNHLMELLRHFISKNWELLFLFQ